MSTRISATRVLEVVAAGVGLAAVGMLAAHPLSSPDTFWHLKLGEIIASTHSIPKTDLFSAVHPDRPWIQVAWLWELLAHGVTTLGGLRALRIAQSGLMIATFAALYMAVRRASGRASVACFVAGCALALFADRFQARPDAPNLLLATLAAPAVLGFREARARTAFGIGLLALVWVNLHAGTSLLLGATLLAVLVGSLLNGWLRIGPCALETVTRAHGRAAAARAASLLALFVAALVLTPNALSAIEHFASALAPITNAHEPEWSPSLVLLQYGSHPALYLAAFAPYLIAIAYAAALRSRYRERGRAAIDLAELLPCAALLGLAALVTRNLFVSLLPLSVIFLRAPAPSRRSARSLVLSGIVIATLAIDLAGRDAYGGSARARVAFARDLAPGAYPEHAAAFMRRAGIQGKLLNFPRWGDYLIERLYPACHVFFDSRRDVTAEMLELLARVARPEARAAALDRAFDRFGIELVVYEAPVFASHRPEGAWLLLYKSGPEEVYQHARGSHATENLERTRRDFQTRAIPLHAEPTSTDWSAAIARAGSVEWLLDPWQRQLFAEQARARTSPDAKEREHGERTEGLLFFRAGAYAQAVSALEGPLARDPADASARYHLAFARLALGDAAGAYAVARAAPRTTLSALNPAQRYRFAQLLRPGEAGTHVPAGPP